MRIEHCRKCGIEMIPSKEQIDACIVYNIPQKLMCTKCNEKTLVRTHPHSYKQGLLTELLGDYNKFKGSSCNEISTFRLNSGSGVKV